MKYKIISIIPARYNSKRLFGKLLIEVNNKSILQHTYECVKKSSLIEKIFIATDSELIKKDCQKYNAECLITSSLPINGTERIIEALEKYENILNSQLIVNVQADHPLIDFNTIDKTILALLEDDSINVSTAVTEVDFETAKKENVVKCVLDNNNNALYFSRSLIPFSKNIEDEKFFYHIGIYCYRTEFLKKLKYFKNTKNQMKEDLEQLKILDNGFKIKAARVNAIPQGVDVLEDLKKVEEILCR
ncbi:MAG: 3-deoxy-D-manno-octulosonate cytidylyltransferase [Chlamydiae bacterium RIFCSPLOWO2_01_FULL_28_7]|nr:MAG: 3-deoxy-D-manno-octulosonate cytidylyltransferase [Chlamydiae bacterium RIFCSPLOWO2_01_FULL_28_7]